MRWRWALLGVAFILWFSACVSFDYALSVAQPNVAHAHSDMLLCMLRGVPLALLLSRSEGAFGRTSVQLLDGLQALLLAVLLIILLLPAVVHIDDPTGIVTDRLVLAYFDSQNFGLALLSLIALGRSMPANQRTLAHASAWLLTTYALTAFMIYHRLLTVPQWEFPTAWTSMVGQLPIVIFIWIATKEPGWRVQPEASRLQLTIDSFLTAGFCVATVSTAIQISFSKTVVGVSAAILGLLLFAFRSAVMQADLFKARRELAVARDKLERLANIDALTSLPNRRRFDEQLAVAWRRIGRSPEKLAVTMIDVDHFKLYNDVAGHIAGDNCLRAVASAMRKSLRRDGDVLFRYGGEEFAFVTLVTDDAQALATAELLRRSVEDAGQHHAGTNGVVTVSVGVATGSQVSHKFALAVVLDADRALYIAKKNGRNQVIAL